MDGANTYMFSPVCDVWLYKVALGKYYICWTTQQVTVHSKFRVILRIWFDIITTMIVQNTILKTYFFRIESLEGEKKNLLNHAAGNSAQQIQSYPSDWVRHYHYNDCAKYHFNNKLISNWKFLEGEKKNLLNRAAGNSAQQIQSYPSDMVRHYHYNDCTR